MRDTDGVRKLVRDNKKPQQARLVTSLGTTSGVFTQSTLGASMKFVSVMALSGLFFASTSIPTLAANRHVDIVNATGKTLSEFYASNSGTDDWEEDVLGSDTLADGEVFDVDIDDGTGACKFDFKAVFTDGTSHVRRGVDVCSISKFTYRR